MADDIVQNISLGGTDQFAKDLRDLSALGQDAFKKLAEAADKLSKIEYKQFDKLKDSLDDTGRAASDTGKKFNDLRQSGVKAGEEIGGVWSGVTGVLAKTGLVIDGITKSYSAITGLLPNFSKYLNDASATVAKFTTAGDSYEKKLKSFIELQGALNTARFASAHAANLERDNEENVEAALKRVSAAREELNKWHKDNSVDTQNEIAYKQSLRDLDRAELKQAEDQANAAIVRKKVELELYEARKKASVVTTTGSVDKNRISQEDITKLKDYKKASDELGKAYEYLEIKIGAILAPKGTERAKWMTSLIDGSRELLNDIDKIVNKKDEIASFGKNFPFDQPSEAPSLLPSNKFQEILDAVDKFANKRGLPLLSDAIKIVRDVSTDLAKVWENVLLPAGKALLDGADKLTEAFNKTFGTDFSKYTLVLGAALTPIIGLFNTLAIAVAAVFGAAGGEEADKFKEGLKEFGIDAEGVKKTFQDLIPTAAQVKEALKSVPGILLEISAAFAAVSAYVGGPKKLGAGLFVGLAADATGILGVIEKASLAALGLFGALDKVFAIIARIAPTFGPITASLVILLAYGDKLRFVFDGIAAAIRAALSTLSGGALKSDFFEPLINGANLLKATIITLETLIAVRLVAAIRSLVPASEFAAKGMVAAFTPLLAVLGRIAAYFAIVQIALDAYDKITSKDKEKSDRLGGKEGDKFKALYDERDRLVKELAANKEAARGLRDVPGKPTRAEAKENVTIIEDKLKQLDEQINNLGKSSGSDKPDWIKGIEKWIDGLDSKLDSTGKKIETVAPKTSGAKTIDFSKAVKSPETLEEERRAKPVPSGATPQGLLGVEGGGGGQVNEKPIKIDHSTITITQADFNKTNQPDTKGLSDKLSGQESTNIEDVRSDLHDAIVSTGGNTVSAITGTVSAINKLIDDSGSLLKQINDSVQGLEDSVTETFKTVTQEQTSALSKLLEKIDTDIIKLDKEKDKDKKKKSPGDITDEDYYDRHKPVGDDFSGRSGKSLEQRLKEAGVPLSTNIDDRRSSADIAQNAAAIADKLKTNFGIGRPSADQEQPWVSPTAVENPTSTNSQNPNKTPIPVTVVPEPGAISGPTFAPPPPPYQKPYDYREVPLPPPVFQKGETVTPYEPPVPEPPVKLPSQILPTPPGLLPGVNTFGAATEQSAQEIERLRKQNDDAIKNYRKVNPAPPPPAGVVGTLNPEEGYTINDDLIDESRRRENDEAIKNSRRSKQNLRDENDNATGDFFGNTPQKINFEGSGSPTVDLLRESFEKEQRRKEEVEKVIKQREEENRPADEAAAKRLDERLKPFEEQRKKDDAARDITEGAALPLKDPREIPPLSPLNNPKFDEKNTLDGFRSGVEKAFTDILRNLKPGELPPSQAPAGSAPIYENLRKKIEDEAIDHNDQTPQASIEDLNSKFSELSSSINNAIQAIGQLASAASSAGSNVGEETTSAAGGGLLSGPGTGTSDSIPINASDGEFVVNARSTARHLPLLHAINNFSLGGIVGNMTDRMTLPSFATGGPVTASVGAGAPAALHPVTINFEGQKVSGLHAPTNVVSAMRTAAVHSQNTSTSRVKPSHYR